MATCSKCGGEVSTDQQICAACGTPTGAAVPAFQPVQSAAPAFQPVQPAAQQAPPSYAAAPAAAPAKSGPSALKIILIIVAIIVGLGMLGVGGVVYLGYKAVHAIHQDKNGNVSMNGFGLSANSADNLTTSDLGVDIYPGAEQAKGGMKMNIAGTSTVVGKFVTSDSKDAVFAFYKDKLGADANSFNYPSSAMISLNKGQQESIMITIVPNSSAADGKTQISIQHTKKG